MQLYDHGAATHRKGACCAGQDIHDARAVAERIGIPHYVLDYESRFKEAVIDRFAESYVAGETPVPCVECNQSIKFRDLLGDRARARRARCWRPATTSPRARCPDGGRALYRAREAERDQSYFLFATTREQLDLLRFPLGDSTKAETRELARGFGLPVADKHDSQDICFVPSGPLHRRDRAAQAGRRRAGRHRRSRRAGCSAATTASSISPSVSGAGSASRPASRSTWCGSTPPRGRVVVGPREALRTQPHAAARRQLAGRRHASTQALCAGWHEVFVKVRSTRPPQPAWLSRGARGIEVELVDGEDGVSPGQACVFYDAADGQARVLGGGFIQSAVAARRRIARRARTPVALSRVRVRRD